MRNEFSEAWLAKSIGIVMSSTYGIKHPEQKDSLVALAYVKSKYEHLMTVSPDDLKLWWTDVLKACLEIMEQPEEAK